MTVPHSSLYLFQLSLLQSIVLCVCLPSALQVGFEQEEYSVMEEEGVVEVCVGRVGRSEVPVSILVATQELSMDQPQRATSKPTQGMSL